MKRVYSGLLQVQAKNRPNLAETLAYFDENLADSDYVVGWIDAFASGSALGRSNMHRANYLPPGVDHLPSQTLRLDFQHLPDNLFGVLPKSVIWRFMRPFINNPGTRLVNSLRYHSAGMVASKSIKQSHSAFHFLLDYVPGWKRAYGRGGLIQYQPFIPVANALGAFSEILQLCQHRGLPNYLTVIKRHRPDDFLISYGLDGYSLAMDFRITDRNRARMAALAQELDEIVLQAGGRFYFAKDSTLRPSAAAAYLGEDVIRRFRELKRRCDPDEMLQSNLWRRIFC
jgi:FAD/FMN-containing dehydrogenase